MTKEQQDAWGGAIGGLLINFGAVEFVSFQWIDRLSIDRVVRDIAIELTLSKRINLLKRLIRRSDMTAAQKETACLLWDEVSELAKVRNVVAHNPLVVRRVNGQFEAGVINTKQMKGIWPFKILPINIQEIGRAGSSAAHVLGKLHKLSTRLPNGDKSS
jgi:hypothetical protein